MTWQLPYPSGRQPVLARNVVSTSQPLAAQAGAAAFARGGNAIDAALAAAITPEEHKYLYFVAITDGGRHAFSTNLDDHNRAVRQYLKNRRAQRQQ